MVRINLAKSKLTLPARAFQRVLLPSLSLPFALAGFFMKWGEKYG